MSVFASSTTTDEGHVLICLVSMFCAVLNILRIEIIARYCYVGLSIFCCGKITFMFRRLFRILNFERSEFWHTWNYRNALKVDYFFLL